MKIRNIFCIIFFIDICITILFASFLSLHHFVNDFHAIAQKLNFWTKKNKVYSNFANPSNDTHFFTWSTFFKFRIVIEASHFFMMMYHLHPRINFFDAIIFQGSANHGTTENTRSEKKKKPSFQGQSFIDDQLIITY